MRKLLLFVLCISCQTMLNAQENQDDQKNVVISKSTRKFSFVKGDAEHPVQIKEESTRTYRCNSYRTEIPVVELYDDQETIDNVSILVAGSKKHGISPKHDYYQTEGIFYSDARICYFQLPLEKKGSESEVTFKKTILDPHYFTTVHFMADVEILEQEIKIIVPSWMKLEIKKFNFNQFNIQENIVPAGDETVYTYTMKSIPPMRNEQSAPGPSYFAPHILILSKSAQPKDVKFTYFNTVKDQYEWYKKLVMQIGNDEKIIREKTLEITAGLKTDEEKVKMIYRWVQDNVRYIAFENGIAGFKPEKAQEVLRKKYGDCKGMANLLTEMLRSINLDARKCWIGTKHIAYDYSSPSLSVDNHMISAWMNKGKPVFLDATEKYIGFGEIAERIQGRQTLIEDGNQFLLEKVPASTYLQNTATESRRFTVDGNSLKGHIVQLWKGENKEWLLSSLNNVKQDKQETSLKQFLSEGNQSFEISNLKIDNLVDYNADVKVEYDVVWKNVLTVFDKEIYLDVDNRRNLENFKIDTAKRKLPYWFHFKDNLVFETEINLPADKTVTTLPEKLSIKRPGYSFIASYNVSGEKIIYKNEITIDQTELKPQDFVQWNNDIEQLNHFYNQQLVITQKK
jgi:hypothetical protein